MHFWQGTDKYEDWKSEYQNENINKTGRKRKLSLLENSFIVLVSVLLFDLSERFDVFVSLIAKILLHV